MMPHPHHRDVRTALTLDDDVAAKLKAAARRSGRAFRDVVNETIRRGLMAARPERRTPFGSRRAASVACGRDSGLTASKACCADLDWHNPIER